MSSQLIRMTINGREREVHADPWRSLLYVLREQLGTRR